MSGLASEGACHRSCSEGRNSDEVGNVAMLKAISVPLVFGLLERVVANRGDTLRLSPSDCCATCVTGHSEQINSVFD